MDPFIGVLVVLVPVLYALSPIGVAAAILARRSKSLSRMFATISLLAAVMLSCTYLYAAFLLSAFGSQGPGNTMWEVMPIIVPHLGIALVDIFLIYRARKMPSTPTDSAQAK